MKNNDINGFELIEGLSGKSDFWVCGKRNGGDFSAVRVYMRKRPPLLALARSVVAKGKNDRGSTFPCNAVRSPFYKVNPSFIAGIGVHWLLIAAFLIVMLLVDLKMPESVIFWSIIILVSSICAVGFLDSFFSNMPQMMEFSREGVSFFVNGRLSRKISAAALRQIYFVKSAFRIGGKTFDAFRLIAVIEEPGGFGAGRLSSLTLLENVPAYEAALFLEEESERMMGLQDVPMIGEARQRGHSCARGSLDSASVGLSSLPLSLGSLEKDCVAASISGFGDEERLEVRVRTRLFGPWSDFVGWSREESIMYMLIFPPFFVAIVSALFYFGSYRDTFVPSVLAVLALLIIGVIIAVVLLNRTDFSILFSKDSVVVSCTWPSFEKVIRRGEIRRIYCKEYTVKSATLYDVRLLDSGAKTRSLVSEVRSFETANFIKRNAERIMGIVGQRVEGEV